MTVRVLVVDDSGFFRRRVTEILSEDNHIEVVDTAKNGADAINKVSEFKPDVITMDIEMPVMDGITSVRHIMKSMPTPILMFSSLTTEGAQATLDALEAGALDFLPKRFEDISSDRKDAKRVLCARIRALAARGLRPPSKNIPKSASTTNRSVNGKEICKGDFKLVAIGTSTGGPVALQKVLTRLPADFPLPLLLIQHMPGSFTSAFAERLNGLCNIIVKEAEDGDALKPGTALLAPGGCQMLLEKRGASSVVRIREGNEGENYRPCVDLTFNTMAKVFPGKVLALVLTGMGADGREGARALKDTGSSVWAQDEASSIIFGMPGAIVEAGLADQVLALPDIGPSLMKCV